MNQSIIVEIVEAIAEAKGIAPHELNYSMHDYVDTEAIQQLSSNSATSWSLSFELPEYNVTVTNEGAILVDEQIENLPA